MTTTPEKAPQRTRPGRSAPTTRPTTPGIGRGTKRSVPPARPDHVEPKGDDESGRRSRGPGRQDWTSWPRYEDAVLGLRGYWYPVMWSNQLKPGDATQVQVCGERIAFVRDATDGKVRGLHDRCPHRGVPLSLGIQEFPGTQSCPYHGWTFGLDDGQLKAVITDGPDSPICGKVAVRTYPCAERLGMVWVFVGDKEPHPIDEQIPEELVANDFTLGGRIAERTGNWRFAVENGYDEGHAKYLHRTSTWRLFKTMPTWNKTRIIPRGRWIYRVQDEVHWDAEFPGLGTWSNYRWWKKKPPTGDMPALGNTGAAKEPDPVIAAQEFPGFVSLSLPGVLRVAYPTFIHYEFYVPVTEGTWRYVGVMVDFRSGVGALKYRGKYWSAIRPLFHGEFSGQDEWMVDVCDAPPERLYRPDSSLTAWRKMVEDGPVDPSQPPPEGARTGRRGPSASGRDTGAPAAAAAPGRDAPTQPQADGEPPAAAGVVEKTSQHRAQDEGGA